LFTDWATLDHAIIAAAVQQCCHLTSCAKASGGHFEYSLRQYKLKQMMCVAEDNCLISRT